MAWNCKDIPQKERRKSCNHQFSEVNLLLVSGCKANRFQSTNWYAYQGSHFNKKEKGELLNNNLLSIPFHTYISMSGLTTGRESYPVVKKKYINPVIQKSTLGREKKQPRQCTTRGLPAAHVAKKNRKRVLLPHGLPPVKNLYEYKWKKDEKRVSIGSAWCMLRQPALLRLLIPGPKVCS